MTAAPSPVADDPNAAPGAAHAASRPVDLSVVVPVRNEADNILPLIAEIQAALAGRIAFEIVYVDDGSTDETPARLAEARARFAELRRLRHAESCGQSAAIRTGILAARGPLIATLDGDGQNDPADLPALLDAWRAAAPPAGAGAAPPAGTLAMVAGQRTRRQDSALRRLSSRIANRVRNALLGDDTPDTGCGLKLFGREAFLRLPYFDHIHRFLPVLMKREGYAVALLPVNHRPRLRGKSKYGVHNRLWVGIVDLFGVLWLKRRFRQPSSIIET